MKNAPSSNYFRKGRVSSRSALASPWVKDGTAPILPTKMLSNAIVFDGWRSSGRLDIAKQIVAQNPNISLRDLQQLLLEKITKGEIDQPYLWWINPLKGWKRAIHEDSNGVPFIKLNNKWQLVYPIDKIAGLAGAQHSGDEEDVPLNGYFLLKENEDCAKNHSPP